MATQDPLGTYSGAGAAAPTAFPAGTLGNLNQVYSGLPESATAAISGLGTSSFTFTYNGLATPPTNAASYTVVATLVNANYKGSLSGTLVVAKANATVAVTPYNVLFDGNPHTATYTISGVGPDKAAAGSSITLNTTHTNPGVYASDSWSFSGGPNYNNIATTTITDVITGGIGAAAFSCSTKPAVER